MSSTISCPQVEPIGLYCDALTKAIRGRDVNHRMIYNPIYLHVDTSLGSHLYSVFMLALVEYMVATKNKGGAHDKPGDKETGPTP